LTRRRPARRPSGSARRVGGARPPRADLHSHSLRSDGAHPAEQVLAQALAAGLTLFALTDHDVEPALPAGRHEAGGEALHLVHGAEVSGLYAGRELHLLVYFPGEMPDAFRAFLRGRCAARAARYDAAAAVLGLAPAPAEAHTGARAMTRHHLAQALVAARRAPTIDAAFRGALQVGDAVPFVDLRMEDAIATARAAGGLPVWAHPSEGDVERHLDALVDAGLVGIEALRPSLTEVAQERLSREAVHRGLIITAGSDCHGHGQQRLGRFSARPGPLRSFLERLGLQPSVEGWEPAA
jgi:predicted metal-dependent phosphoesterase TrpH